MNCKKCGAESVTDICEKCFEPPVEKPQTQTKEKEKPMVSETLKAAVSGKPADVMQAAAKHGVSKGDAFVALLERSKNEIARALPAHINPEKMMRTAMTAVRLNPDLVNCSPLSLLACVIQSSQLGLDFTMGKAFLVPYFNSKKNVYEATFIPGWKGLVQLANNSKIVETWTGAVYDGDYFEYELGARPNVVHRPNANPDAPMTHTYAIGWQRGAVYPIVEVWGVDKIRMHRDRYNKQGEKHYSYKHFEMYARKVVLLQILKYLPCSSELAQAIELNDAAEIGRQSLDIKSAIEGAFVPVPDDEPDNVDRETGEIK